MKIRRVLEIVFFGAIVALAVMKGCEKRNYLLNPVTDEEAEGLEALHSN